MENSNSPIQAALRWGLVLGLIAVALTFVAYFINSALLASFWFGIGTLIVFLGLVVAFGFQYRNEVGGFITFGEAFKFSFIALVVAGFINMIGMILLFQVIDPSLPEVLAQANLDNTLAIVERFGGQGEMSSADIAKMKNDFLANYSVGGQFKGFGISLIANAVIALIVSAIIKKNKKPDIL